MYWKKYKINFTKKLIQISNPNLRTNLAKVGENDTIFIWILDEIIYNDHWLWLRKLKLQMVKYVAEDYFGLKIQQNLVEDANMSNYYIIVKQIAQHIIQKYLKYNIMKLINNI